MELKKWLIVCSTWLYKELSSGFNQAHFSINWSWYSQIVYLITKLALSLCSVLCVHHHSGE